MLKFLCVNYVNEEKEKKNYSKKVFQVNLSAEYTLKIKL